MKTYNLILAMAFVFNVEAAEVCSQHEGSYIYESATSVGNSIAIVRPRIIIAGKPSLILAYPGAPSDTFYGNAFCRAIGMSTGIVSDVEMKSTKGDYVAQLNEKGQVVAFGSTIGDFGIKTVTCIKK